MTRLPRNITLVTGVPRSGASMLIRMLQAGGVSVFRAKVGQPSDGVDCDNAGIRFLRVSAEGLAPAIGGAVRIDHDLLYALPGGFQYHVILAERDLEAIVAEHAAVLGRRPNREPPPSVQRLTFAVRRHQIIITAWLAHRPNLRKLKVQYEQITGQPWASIVAVDHFLGGGLDRHAMAMLVDQTQKDVRS